MSKKRDDQVAWIQEVLQRNSWKRATWTQKANVHHSTLSKFLNSDDPENTLSPVTIKKLADAVPTTLSVVRMISPNLPMQLSEPDTNEWVPKEAANDEIQPFDAAIQAMTAGDPNRTAFTIQTPALAGAGILPGDVLIVDANRIPQEGDVTCVQIYDQIGGAATTFRLYQAPFVTTAPLGTPAIKPILVDNDQVALRGTVIATFRAL